MASTNDDLIQLDLQADVGRALRESLVQLTKAANMFFSVLTADLGWQVPPTRLLLTDDFNGAVEQLQREHSGGQAVIRERLGGRVVGKSFFRPAERSICVIEVDPAAHGDELRLPMLTATIAHELTHIILLQACEDHGDRDLRSVTPPGRSIEAAMTAYSAVEEYRCDVVAQLFVSKYLSLTTPDGVRPITAEMLLGDSYGESALEHLDTTAETIVPAVWRYRLNGDGLEDLWTLVSGHVWEVLTLYAHARAASPESPSVTGPDFTEHQFGQLVSACWRDIATSLEPFELLPRVDNWAEAQRALVVHGGAAVEQLYAALGITPHRNADGSVYVGVEDPKLRLGDVA